MHITRKSRNALIVAVCALITLAIGVVVAQAIGEDGWVGPSELSGDNTLTVVAAENDEDYTNDLAQANVVLDVYKLADTSGTLGYDDFKYTLTSNFTDLQDVLNGALVGDGSYSWQDLADQAAGKVTLHSGTAALGANADLADASQGVSLPDGLYLVLAHGADQREALEADSKAYRYSFNPVVVALPTKEATEANGGIPNTAYGQTLTNQTVFLNLKSSRDMLFGAIRINKTLVSANDMSEAAVQGDPATFIFRITGTAPNGSAYSREATITIPVGESTGSVVVSHIPAGTEVTVEEVMYDHRRFGYESGPDPESFVVTAGDEPCVDFAFVNSNNGTITSGGHGIENNFTYDDSVRDWTWTAVPGDNATQGTQWPATEN